MKYHKFIEEIQGIPYVPPISVLTPEFQLKYIRDNLIKQIVLDLDNKNVLHHLQAMTDFLNDIGLQVRVEEMEKSDKSMQKVILESQAFQTEIEHAFFAEWVHANTASFRTVMSLTEYQMVHYLLALQSIERALNQVNPEIVSFIQRYPDIDLVKFAEDLCVIHQAILNRPGFRESIEQLRQQRGEDREALDNVTQHLNGLIDADHHVMDMWLTFLSSVSIVSNTRDAGDALSAVQSYDAFTQLRDAIATARQAEQAPLANTAENSLEEIEQSGPRFLS